MTDQIYVIVSTKHKDGVPQAEFHRHVRFSIDTDGTMHHESNCPIISHGDLRKYLVGAMTMNQLLRVPGNPYYVGVIDL